MAAEFACPACRKAAPSAASGTACLRCGCDLSELLLLADAASAELARARLAFARGDAGEAARHAASSLRLRRTPAARELLDLVT